MVVKASRGFDEAPPPILKALHRLTWAGKTAIHALNTLVQEKELATADGSMPPQFIPFNELLSLGYFSSSVINVRFHGQPLYLLRLEPFNLY